MDRRRASKHSKIGLGPEGVRLVEHMVFCQVPASVPARAVWAPATDVFETGTAVAIRMEIAGVRAEQIQIQATDSTLVVGGVRIESDRETRRRVDQMEIAYGPFERAVPLPATVVPEKGIATLRDGLLEILLPKATDAPAQAVRVEIRL